MNIIENGDFESETTEPWRTLTGEPLGYEIISANNKKWLLTDGMNGPAHGSFRQIIPATGSSWGNDFRFTVTAKSIPTGGTATAGIQADNEANRLNGLLSVYFSIYHMGTISDKFATYAEVSVKESTYSIRFKQFYSEPASHAELIIVNWGGGSWDNADILVTDIKIELVDPTLDPEAPGENTKIIDFPPLGLSKVNAPRMKEIK